MYIFFFSYNSLPSEHRAARDQSRKFAFLSHFLAELRTMHTDFDVLQRQRAAETDRLRPYFIVAEADLNAALNRLARNLVDFSKDAVQSRLMPVREK